MATDFSTLGEGWEYLDGDQMIDHVGLGSRNECHICPVGVGGGHTPGATFGTVNRIMHQLVKGLQAPKFDDTAENWPGFIWDFNAYLQRLSPVSKIQDAYKLHLFEDTMPATLKNEIKLMRKRSGGTLTFAQVAAKFEARYGSSGSNKMRKKWQEVSLPTSGKITSKQLREFQVNFLACADEVKDCTPRKRADF